MISGVYIATIAVVFCIAAGQLVFKSAALAINETGSYWSVKSLALLFAALTLYSITSLAWVLILQRIDLGKVYPFMALAFILVPLGSKFVFGEDYVTQYYIGVLFIMAGIVLCVRA